MSVRNNSFINLFILITLICSAHIIGNEMECHELSYFPKDMDWPIWKREFPIQMKPISGWHPLQNNSRQCAL